MLLEKFSGRYVAAARSLVTNNPRTRSYGGEEKHSGLVENMSTPTRETYYYARVISGKN
jgi:hypothetical protein